MDSVNDPMFIMFNAGLAGIFNMVPGVREAYTGSYHGSYDGYEAIGAPQEVLDSIKGAAIAYGWW